MLRHLRSLRLMRRDNGWINTLLEEAENERMHLLTFMEMRRPGLLFRASLVAAQGIMFNLLFISYLLSPKFCHSLVGYLEEEAVKTYTHAIKVRVRAGTGQRGGGSRRKNPLNVCRQSDSGQALNDCTSVHNVHPMPTL